MVKIEISTGNHCKSQEVEEGGKGNLFFVFLFCDHFTIKVAKRQFFEKMSLDHEVPGCLICKILAKRLGAHQEEGA